MLRVKIHYFRDADDNCTVVRTSWRAGGGYRAVVVESQLDYTPASGHGMTRMAAIADLNSKIWKEYLACDAVS